MPISSFTFSSRPLRSFFTNLLLYLSLLAILTISAYFATGHLCDDHRLATSSIKQARLQQIPEQKLILIGGSNLQYGINSSYLSEQLGMPVVNMGLQGSIGMAYYFQEIMPWVNEGDLVFLLAEHYLYNYETAAKGGQALYNLASIYPSSLAYLNTNQVLRSPLYVGESIKENTRYLIRRSQQSDHEQRSFFANTNTYGDYEGHKGLASKYKGGDTKNSGLDSTKILPAGIIDFLLAQREEVRVLGGELYFGFAPIASSAVNLDEVEQLDIRLKAVFGDHVLGQAKSYVLSDTSFYDTHYHLRYDERDLRTDMLIRDVQENISLRQNLNLKEK